MNLLWIQQILSNSTFICFFNTVFFRFQKTEAMTKILEERRNRSSAKSKAKKPKDETEEQEPSKQISSADVAMASKSRLDLLVESVKRKSAIALEKKSSGKRPRTK